MNFVRSITLLLILKYRANAILNSCKNWLAAKGNKKDENKIVLVVKSLELVEAVLLVTGMKIK